MSVWLCCAVFLLIIGLSTDSDAANIPHPASYVYELQGVAQSYAPDFHTRETAAANTDGSHGSTCLVYGSIAGAHLAGSILAYDELTKTWGASNGRFHFKNEIDDGLAFNDEVSHLFVGYKLTQGFSSAYRILGFSEERARFLGLLESAVIMTAVELPVDAYNPRQGFGITDIVADYVGIGLAWFKAGRPELDRIDLKMSIKSFSAQPDGLLGGNYGEYDNYIYWLTCRFRFVVLGAGYSTTRTSSYEADPQMFLGIGSTIPDLIRPVSGKLASRLKPLEIYFFNFNLQAL